MIKYHHYRLFLNGSLQAFGGVTIATRFNQDTERYEYGVAICSPLDNYCKETGRNYAYARMIDTSSALTLSSAVAAARAKALRNLNTKGTKALAERKMLLPGWPIRFRIAKIHDHRKPLLAGELFFGVE
jgi:hypothetical protein